MLGHQVLQSRWRPSKVCRCRVKFHFGTHIFSMFSLESSVPTAHNSWKRAAAIRVLLSQFCCFSVDFGSKFEWMTVAGIVSSVSFSSAGNTLWLELTFSFFFFCSRTFIIRALFVHYQTDTKTFSVWIDSSQRGSVRWPVSPASALLATTNFWSFFLYNWFIYLTGNRLNT